MRSAQSVSVVHARRDESVRSLERSKVGTSAETSAPRSNVAASGVCPGGSAPPQERSTVVSVKSANRPGLVEGMSRE